MTPRRILILAATVAAFLATPRVEAGPITYVQTVVGSGSLGGVTFTDRLLTFTQTADTNSVVPFFSTTLLIVPALTSTVNVAGIGTASFTIPTSVISNGDPAQPGRFYLINGTPAMNGPFILGQFLIGADGYDLRTTIGPLNGTGTLSINPNGLFGTSSGVFQLTSTSGNTTFRATLGAVPEPATSMLMGAGILGVLAAARSGRRPD